MYRQPENSNRVKSMKSRFEGLNGGSPPNDKFKKSPAHVINKTLNGRISQRRENNNNDIKKSTTVDYNSKRNAVTSLKEKNCNIDNVKINILKNREEKDVKTNNNRERSRVMDSNKFEIEKVKRLDFSDINKKELCNVPPLNLTRQLNDPSKKGCIKRTPAFRKDKFNNKSKPSSEDLNFANIVKIFEENDKDNTCDSHLREEKNMTKICSDGVLKSGATSVNVSPKLPLKTSVSLIGRFIIPTTTVNAIKSTEKTVQVQKQKLTSSSSLDLESSNSKCVQPASLKQKSLSPQRPSTPEIATLKIGEKEKIFRPILSNNDLETTKEITPLVPAYAQVVKHKKPEPQGTDVLTDTLKAALKQPLPTGPPPKKPPRTFAHTPNSKSSQKNESSPSTSLFCEKLNESLKIKTPEPEKKATKTKSDPKLMLQKLENALLNNKLRSPKFSRKNKNTETSNSTSSSNSNLKVLPLTQPNIYTSDSPQKNIFPNCLPSLNCAYSKNTSTNSYTKVPSPQMGKNVAMSTFFTDWNQRKSQEPIYAEPFQYQVKEDSGNPGKIVVEELSPGRTDTLSSSVHYLVRNFLIFFKSIICKKTLYVPIYKQIYSY